jgi:hypothetical protein
MKTTAISTIILLASAQLFGQGNSFDLPKEWDKTFIISVSHTGSMSGGSSHLRFTYDSCLLVINSNQGPPAKKTFALSQKDRVEILKKMNELNVEKIKEGLSFTVQNDGWSNLLCFSGHCIEGGSASKMSEKDKDRFLTACGYLERFAADK